MPTSSPHLFAVGIMIFGPCCDGVSTVGGGVWKAGFKGGGGVRISFSGF